MSLSPATFYDDNGVVRLQGQLEGGGSPATVSAVTVRLSSAAILALNSTPKTLVSGVAGSAILPVSASLVVIAGATPYTMAATLRVFIGATFGTAGWGGNFTTSSPFTTATSKAMFSDISQALEQDLEALATLDGQPLRIDSTDAITDGDGTAVITTCYYLAPLA